MGGRGAKARLGGGVGGGLGGKENYYTNWRRFQRTNDPLPGTMRTALEQAFKGAPQLAKDLYDRYIRPGGEVLSTQKNVNAAYWSSINKIVMNLDKAARNEIASVYTWFHEHGHYIDFNLPGANRSAKMGAISGDKDFMRLLERDVRDHIRQLEYDHAAQMREYMSKLRSKYSPREAERRKDAKLAERLLRQVIRESDLLSKVALSDTVAAALRTKIPGFPTHDAAYWRRGKYRAGSESAANMFTAHFDPALRGYMEKIFPNAWSYFNKTLEKDRKRWKTPEPKEKKKAAPKPRKEREYLIRVDIKTGKVIQDNIQKVRDQEHKVDEKKKKKKKGT